MKLTDMPNVGKTLEKRLSTVGIIDSEELIKTGAKDAFIKLRLFEGDTCFSTLCALEGAIENVRWHYLNAEKKEELELFFRMCCQNKGLEHCGLCSDIPCDLLTQYSCDPEHGDNPHGTRIEQCKKWAKA